MLIHINSFVIIISCTSNELVDHVLLRHDRFKTFLFFPLRIYESNNELVPSPSGLLLLGSVFVCLIACCRNRQGRETISDDLLTIGGSTFYGGPEFMHLEDETELNETQPRHNIGRDGVANPAYPGQNEALM